MIQPIITFPAPTLKLRAARVEFPLTEEVRAHLTDLRDTLAATPTGVALASNQIRAQAWDVFVTRKDLLVPWQPSMSQEIIRGRDGRPLMTMPEVFFNATWEPYPPGVTQDALNSAHEVQEHLDFQEGCLSVPGFSMRAKRECWAECLYQDEDGRYNVWVGRGLAARIIQHETDHLYGRLVLDMAPRSVQSKIRVEALRRRMGKRA